MFLIQLPILAIGFLVLVSAAIPLSKILLALVVPRSAKNNKKLSVANGSWAIVTGASDGIGKEFALQLAALGFDIMLISRSKDKLQAVADEIKNVFQC